MADRPILDKNLNVETFRNCYYLKQELVSFCRKEHLQTTGGKIELTERISHYLDTGEKIGKRTGSRKKPDIGSITDSTLIEADFVCSETHRAFFLQNIGPGFSFNVTFQKWLKENTGETYKNAVEAYYKIKEDKKNGKSSIDKQFEYNTYIRDFFADNKGKSLGDAVKCWKYKKNTIGQNKYEKQDLIALD